MARNRNQHQWGWQGFDSSGVEYEYCPLCRKWRAAGRYVQGPFVPTLFEHPGAKGSILHGKLSPEAEEALGRPL